MFTKIKNDSCFHYETHIGKNRKEKEKQINTLACHVGWQAQTGGQLLRRCASRARKLNSARMLFWISETSSVLCFFPYGNAINLTFGRSDATAGPTFHHREASGSLIATSFLYPLARNHFAMWSNLLQSRSSSPWLAPSASARARRRSVPALPPPSPSCSAAAGGPCSPRRRPFLPRRAALTPVPGSTA